MTEKMVEMICATVLLIGLLYFFYRVTKDNP